MIFRALTFISAATFLVVCSLLVAESGGKPWAQNMNPLGQLAASGSGRTSCAPETENICQRCAKRTKSPVVYPWCCVNHEGAREWCENYLYYGLR